MVSVVIPVKDAGRTFEACVRSIRAQTWEPLELIVIDNAHSPNKLPAKQSQTMEPNNSS